MIATRRIVALWLVAAALESPSPALAEDTFQAEAGLTYSRLKADTVRQNIAGAEATFFFDRLPILPKDYPLDQAQFVERVGSLSANYSRTYNNYDDFQSLSNGSMYGATVLLARPGTPLFVSAGYDSFYSGKLGVSSFPSFETESDTKSYQLEVGAYVDKATAFSLNWSKGTVRTTVTSSIVPSSTFKDTFTSIGFSGRHLARLSGGDHVAFVAGVSRDTVEQEGVASEKNRNYFFQVTYYPTKMLGLNLGVSSDRGDDRSSEGEIYFAGIRMFVTPTLSLSLDFQQNHAKALTTVDYDFVTLKALMRF